MILDLGNSVSFKAFKTSSKALDYPKEPEWMIQHFSGTTLIYPKMYFHVYYSQTLQVSTIIIIFLVPHVIADHYSQVCLFSII